MIAYKGDHTASVSFRGDLNASLLSEFVEENRLPLLAQLSINNAHDYQDHDHMTVLCLINPRSSDESKRFLDMFSEVAKANYRRFLFAWIDGLRWESFAEQFGIGPERFPVVLVWHPKMGYHYDDPKIKTKKDIENFLDAIEAGNVRPLGAGKGFFAEFYKAYYAIAAQADKHPYIAIGVACTFAALIAACCFCPTADYDDEVDKKGR